MVDNRNDGGNLDLRAKLKELLPKDFEELDESERRRAHTRAALQFESFIIEVLRLLGGRPEERAVRSQGSRQFDFVSGSPIRDLTPPIAFEVKFFRAGEQMAIALLDSRVRDMAIETGIRTLVIVTNHQPSERDKGIFWSRISSQDERLRYEWWGPDELQELLSHLGEKGRKIAETLPVAGLGAALRRVSQGVIDDDWKSAQVAIISELRESWRDDQLVFFLGAGVSIEAGVPPWSSLLATLYSRLLGEIAPDIVESSVPTARADAVKALLALQDNSPLMSARVLRSGLKDFHEDVRAVLYANASSGKQPLDDPRKPQDSSQLIELARLCDPPRGRVGARAVVTYNFDDFLEQNLHALNVSYLSICTGNSRAGWTQLPVYHVHGLIPQQGVIPSGQTLVFSEEGYHTAYNNPYTWSNVVQLNLMTQYTCMFVGLSMTDPNLRRLLEIASAAQSGPRHVALLRRAKFSDPTRSAPQCSSEDISCAWRKQKPISRAIVASVLAYHHNSWETTMGELGVRILWFEEFDEIQAILASIRGA